MGWIQSSVCGGTNKKPPVGTRGQRGGRVWDEAVALVDNDDAAVVHEHESATDPRATVRRPAIQTLPSGGLGDLDRTRENSALEHRHDRSLAESVTVDQLHPEAVVLVRGGRVLPAGRGRGGVVGARRE